MKEETNSLLKEKALLRKYVVLSWLHFSNAKVFLGFLAHGLESTGLEFNKYICSVCTLLHLAVTLSLSFFNIIFSPIHNFSPIQRYRIACAMNNCSK